MLSCTVLLQVAATETCYDFSWTSAKVGEFSLMKIWVNPGSSESNYSKFLFDCSTRFLLFFTTNILTK